ncbi:MAG: hydroxymethylglutaryl-CoA lyase [Pseudomonadota bacterium]
MTRIEITEVGARDGLQNEPHPIPTAQKVALIDALSACGFPRIEAASFVSPKWVPQMADGAAVMAAIAHRRGTIYSALTPNEKGYAAARSAGAGEVAIFAAASETFSKHNINASIAESLARFVPLCEAAAEDGTPVRGYVSCAVVCPYEGPVAPGAVASVVEALLALGCRQISLGDTLGRGTPESIGAMLDVALDAAPAERLAGHYHDTNGRALESVAVSVERGLTAFDASVGGLGGCPFAPGAKGNLATSALVDWCAAQGLATGIERTALARAEAIAHALRGACHGV